METTIRINNLTKKFGKVVALDHVSLVIEPENFRNTSRSIWVWQDDAAALRGWFGRSRRWRDLYW